MSSIEAIKTLQQRGDLAAASALCQQLLQTDSTSLALWALQGVLYCQNGELEQGRACLQHFQNQTAAQLEAQTLTDIAATHLLLNEPLIALQVLTHALQQQPNYLLAQMRRGITLMTLGQFAAAQAQLQNVLTAHLDQEHRGAVHINLARCALHLADTAQALVHVEAARDLGASGLQAWLLVAVDTYAALNRWQDAELLIETAQETGMDAVRCALLLAFVLAAQDKHPQATHKLSHTLKKHPDNLELLCQLADLARVQGHYGQVIRYLKATIKLAPSNSSLWAQLAQSGQRHLDAPDSQKAAANALHLTEQTTGLKRAEALVAMASVSSDENLTQSYYEQALMQVADYVPACLGLGQLWLQWGRIDDAIAQFEAVAQRHPIAGVGALINARRFPDDAKLLARIETMAYLPSLQGAMASSLLFDLAAAWEHRQDYAKAFHFASQANAASRKFLKYSAKEHRAHCLAIMATFSEAFFASHRHYGNPSTLPVFVLGMPRSGTTLVEQILGGHEDIFVAGEIACLASTVQRLNAWERHIGSGQHYPNCVADLTAEQAAHFASEVLAELQHYSSTARYIVDKLPHNFEHIGLIRLLFPNAPIIHVLREPRDVAVSNYFVDYQAKFGGMGFAYDLEDIGEQLRDYQALMSHWDKVVSKPILTVRYEDVVADTASAARRILAYMQLEWTSSVLNYQNLERAVKTASVWQVRQPIYQSSTEKWRRYAAFLAPLEAVLALPPVSVAPERGLEKPLPAGYFFQGMRYLQAGDWQAALLVFDALLARYPHHGAALHMKGIAHYQAGAASIALPLLRQSIARQPRHSSWYANLSVVLSALGNHEQASAAAEKSQQLKNLPTESDDFWQLSE